MAFQVVVFTIQAIKHCIWNSKGTWYDTNVRNSDVKQFASTRIDEVWALNSPEFWLKVWNKGCFGKRHGNGGLFESFTYSRSVKRGWLCSYFGAAVW